MRGKRSAQPSSLKRRERACVCQINQTKIDLFQRQSEALKDLSERIDTLLN